MAGKATPVVKEVWCRKGPFFSSFFLKLPLYQSFMNCVPSAALRHKSAEMNRKKELMRSCTILYNSAFIVFLFWRKLKVSLPFRPYPLQWHNETPKSVEFPPMLIVFACKWCGLDEQSREDHQVFFLLVLQNYRMHSIKARAKNLLMEHWIIFLEW